MSALVALRLPARASLPRTAALPEMATAVLIMNEDRFVEYVNASAEALFTPVDPIGCSLPALFASCGATGGDDVFAPIDAGKDPTTSRVRLSDGRSLDCTLRVLSSGGFVLSIDDVTTLVRNAELAHRDALTGLANRQSLRDQLIERTGVPHATASRLQYYTSTLIGLKRLTTHLATRLGICCCAR